MFAFQDDNRNPIYASNVHRNLPIDEISNKKHYDEIGINPESYDSFESFLMDFQTMSGVDIKPLTETFSISLAEGDNTIYIPFDFPSQWDLFADEISKNLAILDIYTAYKNWDLYGNKNSQAKRKLTIGTVNHHPEYKNLQKVFATEVNVYDFIKELQANKKLRQTQKELLAYLYDFTWDYSKSRVLKKQICASQTTCKWMKTLQVTGKVVDTDGNPIPNAKIELLNDPKYATSTQEDGTYSMKFETLAFSHLRFKASLFGYSDAFSSYSFDEYLSPLPTILAAFTFKLAKANSVVILDETAIKDRDGKKYYFFDDKKGSQYYIPVDGLHYKSGKLYTGTSISIYTYFFKKDSNMQDLLENDTFQPVYGYVGNIMKTFGMPYIQVFSTESQPIELFTYSTDPMKLQNQVYHMKELYENHDKIYEKLTKKDMKFLVEKSNEIKGYPITFDFLIENNLLRWPARWSLDRQKWIWINVWHKVLNTDGLVELPFYHILVSQ